MMGRVAQTSACLPILRPQGPPGEHSLIAPRAAVNSVRL